ADDDPDVVITTFGVRHRVDSQRGDAEGAFATAPVKIDQIYVTPTETHNPIELHATTAIWDGSTLTLYESSQGVVNLQSVLAQMFGLPKENVRVITKFLGSGFGGKLFPWTHCPLAAAAARQLATPVQYSVPNLRVTFGRARRNIGAAADMRGPGAVTGLYATESALNELAEQLKIDPVQLRILNEPKIDESLGIPFSSRHLLECF